MQAWIDPPLYTGKGKVKKWQIPGVKKFKEGHGLGKVTKKC